MSCKDGETYFLCFGETNQRKKNDNAHLFPLFIVLNSTYNIFFPHLFSSENVQCALLMLLLKQTTKKKKINKKKGSQNKDKVLIMKENK